MDDLRDVWTATDQSLPSRDVDAAWEDVRRTLELEEKAGGIDASCEEKQDGNTGEERKRPRGLRHGGYRFATRLTALSGVVLLATVLVTALVYEFSGGSDAGATPRVFTTNPGERATLRLSDGSKVRLNVDSRLTLAEGFGTDNRTVSLDGEAFFKVAHDTSLSFVVRMNGARATALGTAFNVEAYAEASRQEVAVTEGLVSLQAGQTSSTDDIRLKPNHLGMVLGSHLQALRDDAAVHKTIAWTDGQLVFSDAAFNEVVRRLERWYNVEIVSHVEAREVDRLNASFHEESLAEAVEAISVALDLEYRQKEDAVVFYRRD
jgi:ferric-dicitrate binding protein FerR (iron transport regulator)